MFDAGTLKAATEATGLGVECISVTFGLFLCLHVLPGMQSIMERTVEIEKFIALCSTKRVILGTDMVDVLTKFKTA
jgi:hypothetical protein